MGFYDDLAGAADHLAGSTDEAVGRATDSATDFEWTGLPGAPDAEPDGETPDDLPATSYVDPGDYGADDVGGNEGTGQSIVEATPVTLDENGGGIDVGETLGLPDVPWKVAGAAAGIGLALWLLRPYAGLADSAT